MILKSRLCSALLHSLKTLDGSIRVQQYLCCRSLLTPTFWSRSLYATYTSNRTLVTSSLDTTVNDIRSIIDERNVFRSRHEDVQISSDSLHRLVWKNVDQWWNSTALICAQTGKSYTYGELRKLSGRFATSLRRNNFLPGTTVAAILPNIPEYAIILLGASEAGLRVTPVNPSYTAPEIDRQLTSSEAKVVITTAACYRTVVDSMKLGNKSMPIIVIPDGTDVPSDTINFRDFVADGIEEFDKTDGKLTINSEVDTVILPYSSGTTGPPKGVEITHRNIVAIITIGRHPAYEFIEKARNDFQEIIPLFLPIYHMYGMVSGLLSSLSMGAKLICMAQFTSDNLLELLENNRITVIYVVPPIMQLMTMDPRFSKKHLMHLKLLGCGGASLSPELITKFRLKMGDHFELIQGYGLTETTSLVTIGKNAAIDSQGFVIPNTQIRVVKTGEDGDENLGIDEIGEFYIKGPQIMKGYFKNAEATMNCMDDDWFKTGDVGYLDDKGHLFITGRLKELIKVQGYQVSPTELENLIHGHEKVADAAVIGVPHERFGEVPKAFVVPKPGVTITEEEIKEFVAAQVTKYKQIAHVVFIPKIIRSPAGKILRNELQKL